MKESSRAVVRSLKVLEQLSVAVQPLTNEQLARALGAPPSSVHRLLKKLVELDYVQFDPKGSSYSIGARLGELAVRLADVACRSLPIRQLLTSLRASTGHYVAVWVPSGVHVRLSALITGSKRGPLSNSPGEIAPAFSTPGLALALNYTEAEVRDLARHCRTHGEPLGRGFTTVREVFRALRAQRAPGYVTGYNLRFDGWGMLAWPIPVTFNPIRHGALSIGAPVDTLRRQEAELVALAHLERQKYVRLLRETSTP